jgi:hypothetical protein
MRWQKHSLSPKLGGKNEPTPQKQVARMPEYKDCLSIYPYNDIHYPCFYFKNALLCFSMDFTGIFIRGKK